MSAPEFGRESSPPLPWTIEQVDALNRFQQARHFHPFTCGSGARMDAAHASAKVRLGLSDWGALVATPEGWICPACDYRQDWAHGFMFLPLLPDPFAAVRARITASQSKVGSPMKGED